MRQEGTLCCDGHGNANLCSFVQANHHTMVGSTEDPPNGPAVAGSVFTAVIVYAVRISLASSAEFGPKSMDRGDST